MSEMKKLDSNKNDLKYADTKKTSENVDSKARSVSEIFGTKKIDESRRISRVSPKKKLPLAVDIIMGIIMLALVVGLAVGAYMLFRYYSNDYIGLNIEYTVAVTDLGELSDYVSLKNKEVFCDEEQNTRYLGKITDVQVIEVDGKQSAVLLTISANVKYRDGEGYSISDKKIAVGSEITLRSGTKSIDGSVVELSIVK